MLVAYTKAEKHFIATLLHLYVSSFSSGLFKAARVARCSLQDALLSVWESQLQQGKTISYISGTLRPAKKSYNHLI